MLPLELSPALFVAELPNLQKCVGEDFCCRNVLEDFCGDFPGGLSGHFFPQNEEKKSGKKIREKNPAAEK